MKWYDLLVVFISLAGIYSIGFTKHGIECLISGIVLGAYFMRRYDDEIN